VRGVQSGDPSGGAPEVAATIRFISIRGVTSGLRRRMFRQIVRGLFGDDSGHGEYQCQRCGRAFEHRRQVCPACDGYRIERREW
jgi:rubrerythrin